MRTSIVVASGSMLLSISSHSGSNSTSPINEHLSTIASSSKSSWVSIVIAVVVVVALCILCVGVVIACVVVRRRDSNTATLQAVASDASGVYRECLEGVVCVVHNVPCRGD
jgi:hypothetical protein